MRSSADPTLPADRGPGATFRAWNRRLHLYAGLYFLFFTWLFALTGLMLNHGSWSAALFWPDRQVTTEEQAFRAPPEGSNLSRAQDLMLQLGLRGEIQWLTTATDPDRLSFRVARPGVTLEVQADFRTARAKVQRTTVNAWGAAQALHTFSGTPYNDTKNERDWILTTVWALAMDALAAGFALLVVGGVVMWLALPGKRLGGFIALASGTLVCGWLVIGLRWFSS